MSATRLSGKLRTVFQETPWTALKWGITAILMIGWYLPAIQTLAGDALGGTWLLTANRMVVLAGIAMVAISVYRARNAAALSVAPQTVEADSVSLHPASLVDLRDR